MSILAIDTATQVSSVAVASADKLAAELTMQAKLTHSETLMPHIKEVLRMANVRKEQLEGIAVSIGLIIWLTRLKPEEKRLALALALVLGGAIGNLIDRTWLGHVIDFIQLYYQNWYWPTFNIADSAITVGAVLLVLDSLHSKDANSIDRSQNS